MIDRDIVKEVVEKNIAETDMFLIEVDVKPGNFISVVVDSDTAITVDRCAEINKTLVEFLENAGEEDFELSVFSAGLSEPLKLKRQYLKYLGKDVEVLLKTGKKQKATLIAIDDETLVIEYESKIKENGSKKVKKIRQTEKIGLETIKSTKLVIKV